jgi:hypothetical protein
VTRLLVVIATGAALLAGCAENNGMTRTRSDARTFGEAHSECWALAMNSAGNAATAAQSRVYDACMARHGWADRRTIM